MKINELMFVKYFRLLRRKATLKFKRPEADITLEVYLGFKEGKKSRLQRHSFVKTGYLLHSC